MNFAILKKADTPNLKGRYVMKLTEIALPQKNRLASAYMDGKKSVLSLFDYDPKNLDHLEQRLAELQDRSYPREDLAEVLQTYNQKFNPSREVLDHIEKLKKPESVVVIGGQQAGVLTGPLYTIHKCISIIQLAKQQEENLGVPVIPVFWIAGEDHDFEEINHTYILKNNRPKKVTVPDKVMEKKSASDIEIDRNSLKKWVSQVVKSFGETEHTKTVYDLLNESLSNSKTFTDWFANLIMSLFKDQGLVLIDSSYEHLRNLEKPYFAKMIEENEALNKAVLAQIKRLRDAEYRETIDLDEKSAHLFYKINDERILLERDFEGHFRGKNEECMLSAEELLGEAMNHPERLSNNVVTRPIMQESLFPTLSFIAGPGEIAYWSTLQKAFHLFDYKVPLIVPRLNITLLDRQTEKWLADRNVPAEVALIEGIQIYKERWLNEQHDWDIDAEASAAKENMNEIHKKMRVLASKVDPGLIEIGDKNIEHIYHQLDYFRRQMQRVVRGRHERELTKFDRLESWLLPNGNPQERIWSVFAFMNVYGIDIVERLIEEPYEFNGKHKILYV